ncbi:hypothetical protein Htur_3451 [Haloterrigena turkmenica DSM 5511]|uniref:DUF7511 domain-containing protein n=1 Tax=Haloterrigena turkmenica (strain ATCC 51198 / DSM 5511 / JCM 9101 / NCIMB 13204 / VKM B-1734 / 4k) TaxID=543526 RepID=D2RQD6_HALTV|nr:hypothetical protein [Haloterrigena turkmenica]ADB62313.1 hypothetical protein Htur_3451 [Haloterrigena turkmenica DSM 5511]
MSDSANGYDDRTTKQRLASAQAQAEGESGRRRQLECLVVRYRDRPDRCTITPRECSEEERLTHWLSADLSAVVDLEDAR